MDRPLSSRHPALGFIYETNYGFIPGTIAGDGDEIDAYVVGEDKPLGSYEGKCIAVVVRHDDDENKLVVANRLFSENEIMSQIGFVEEHYDTEVILEISE